jgi:hypothetical protein
MSSTLSESLIVWRLAEVACERISRRTIRALQKMAEGLGSGDDSCLTNAWEEICVQVQGQQSAYWETYEETVRQVLSREVTKLPTYEREAIWLQTREGQDWDAEAEESRDRYPLVEDQIVEYLKDEHIYSAAADWNNERIRKYLEQSY